MPNLKDLRIRIVSVESTRKITSAMKMVAASKLRRAQQAAEEARPYAERLDRMLTDFAATLAESASVPPLLSETGKDAVHLLVPVTSDRGLCGGFNGNIVRETRNRAGELIRDGKTVKILCIGRKGRDALKRLHGERIIDALENLSRTVVPFEEARAIAERLVKMYADGEFDVCTVIYNRFQSALTQHVTPRRVIPFTAPKPEADEAKAEAAEKPAAQAEEGLRAEPILEPSESEILDTLLLRNLSMQIFRALVESYASEQGARMTAMDNATRNAGEMIDSLTLTYNRTRQSVITNELIEIISGAEAL
jgi:F-type H+-transporting ATPase subunit gamma